MAESAQLSPASGPRRGGRERKKVEPYGTSKDATANGKGRVKGKGKAIETDEDQDLSEPSSDDEDDEDSDGEPDYLSPKRKSAPKKSAASKPPAAPKAKKARVSNGGGGKAQGKGKQVNGNAADGDEDAEDVVVVGKARGAGSGGAVDIKDDNGLFNALLLPNNPLPQTVESWIDHYQHTGDDDQRGEVGCLKELVEFVFRCCGLSNEIEEDRADDLDGVPDALDTLHSELALDSESASIYPLISKHKSFRIFRPCLLTLLHSFVHHLSLTPLLYITADSPPPSSGPSSPLLHILLTWLTPMTSSVYRAIRHTSTFIVLNIGVGLCDVIKTVEGELGAANKMLEQEVKKHGTAKKVGKEKEKWDKRRKAMEDRVKECELRKGILEDYMKTVMTGVFVHRYRDSDPLIRTDCLRVLGLYMDKNPEEFVSTKHLHYINWAMTDPVKTVRFEAVKALNSVYKGDAPITSLRSFTARCIPRLMEMSMRDIDRDVRVQAVSVLCMLEDSGLLSDEDEEKREQVGWLIFDKDVKVRKAIAEFVQGLWEEEKAAFETKADEVEAAKKGRKAFTKKAAAGKKGGKKGAQAMEEEDMVEEDETLAVDLDDEALKDQFLGWKSLASILTRFTENIEKLAKPAAGDADEDMQDAIQQSQRTKEILAGIAPILTPASGHASIAVDALWSEIVLIQDWQSLVKYLNTDHTGAKIDESVWALTEEEETFMIEVLIAVLKKTGDVAKAKKADEDVAGSDITRIMVRVLPKMFSKHQSETMRIMEVFRIIQTLKLDMYSELRQISAYEALWDNLIKQFFKHGDALALEEGFKTIQTLVSAVGLKTTNTAKYAEFEEALLSSLYDAVVDKDIPTAAFEDEDVHAIESALLRMKTVLLAKNVTNLLTEQSEDQGEPGEPGKGKPWDLILALGERGKLGYKEETKMVEYALRTLTSTLLWIIRGVDSSAENWDSLKAQTESQRDELLAVLEEYAVGNHTNACEDVRKEALSCLVLLYIALRPQPKSSKPATARDTISLEMDDALQFRIAGAVQAAIDKYGELVEEQRRSPDESEESELSDEEGVVPVPKATKKDVRAPPEVVDTVGEEVAFQSFIMLFIMALRTGVIEAQHSAVFLSHLGRLGVSYDACLRDLPLILQDEGIYNGEAEMVQKVVAQALQDSFLMYLDTKSNESEPADTLALAKVLHPAFLVYGPQFKIVRRLDSHAVCDFHTENITWILQKTAGFMKLEKSSKEKRAKDRAKRNAGLCLGYFKVLLSFSAAITGRDALKIKNRLVEVLKANDIIKPAKTKIWDPLHQYERRLVTLASHDSNVKAASRKQVARPAAIAEEDAEDAESDDGVQPVPSARPALNGNGKEASTASVQLNGAGKRAPPVIAKRYSAAAAAAGPSSARPARPYSGEAEDDEVEDPMGSDDEPPSVTPAKRAAETEEQDDEGDDAVDDDESLQLDLEFSPIPEDGRLARGMSQMSEDAIAPPEPTNARKKPRRN